MRCLYIFSNLKQYLLIFLTLIVKVVQKFILQSSNFSNITSTVTSSSKYNATIGTHRKKNVKNYVLYIFKYKNNVLRNPIGYVKRTLHKNKASQVQRHIEVSNVSFFLKYYEAAYVNTSAQNYSLNQNKMTSL